MVGFWDVTNGSISYGGQDIRRIPTKQLMEKISFVSQDNFLFNMSIKDNIKMGNPNATDAEVVAAAKAACCDEFICKLQHGYDTMAGDAGRNLSGGERQRITIARAILKKADVVILDEAKLTDIYMYPTIKSQYKKVQRAITDDSYLELMFPAFLNISFKDMGLTDLSTTEIMNEMILLLEGDDKADNRLKKLLDKLKTLDETKKISMYADTLLRLYGKRIPNDMVKSMLNAFIHSSKGAKYEPEPYIGDIRLLLAKEQYFPVRNLTEKAIQFWKDICIGNLQTMTILGNHFTCIEDEKNAAMVANLILKHI